MSHTGEYTDRLFDAYNYQPGGSQPHQPVQQQYRQQLLLSNDIDRPRYAAGFSQDHFINISSQQYADPDPSFQPRYNQYVVHKPKDLSSSRQNYPSLGVRSDLIGVQPVVKQISTIDLVSDDSSSNKSLSVRPYDVSRSSYPTQIRPAYGQESRFDQRHDPLAATTGFPPSNGGGHFGQPHHSIAENQAQIVFEERVQQEQEQRSAFAPISNQNSHINVWSDQSRNLEYNRYESVVLPTAETHCQQQEPYHQRAQEVVFDSTCIMERAFSRQRNLSEDRQLNSHETERRSHDYDGSRQLMLNYDDRGSRENLGVENLRVRVGGEDLDNQMRVGSDEDYGRGHRSRSLTRQVYRNRDDWDRPNRRSTSRSRSSHDHDKFRASPALGGCPPPKRQAKWRNRSISPRRDRRLSPSPLPSRQHSPSPLPTRRRSPSPSSLTRQRYPSPTGQHSRSSSPKRRRAPQLPPGVTHSQAKRRLRGLVPAAARKLTHFHRHNDAELEYFQQSIMYPRKFMGSQVCHVCGDERHPRPGDCPLAVEVAARIGDRDSCQSVTVRTSEGEEKTVPCSYCRSPTHCIDACAYLATRCLRCGSMGHHDSQCAIMVTRQWLDKFLGHADKGRLTSLEKDGPIEGRWGFGRHAERFADDPKVKQRVQACKERMEVARRNRGNFRDNRCTTTRQQPEEPSRQSVFDRLGW